MDISTATSSRRPFTFDRVVRISFSVILVIGVLMLLDTLKGVLLPFMVACLIAYMLEPVVLWNKKAFRCLGRFVPVALTLLEVTVAMVGFCYLFFPYLVEETTQMTQMLHNYATTHMQIPYVSDDLHRFIRDNIDTDKIARMLSRDEWKALIKSAVSSSWTFLSSSLAFIMGIFSWLIVVLYVIFIMLDYEKVMAGFRHMVPQPRRHMVFRIFGDIKDAMNRYFRGQFLIACLVGVLFSIGFLIIGLPMAVVFGLFIGLLNLVPYLQLISLPVAVLLCLVCTASTGADFWLIFWETMAVYVIVQCVQDLLLTPRIMGNAMGLNPAIILLSLSVWGSLLGFMGLIIALPLTTLLLSYYDRYVERRYGHDDECTVQENNSE